MHALKFLGAGFVSLALAGCLVSEAPVLDSKNGKARPLQSGAHLVCGLTDDGALDECEPFVLIREENGAYVFVKEDEDPVRMRFRRIGRKAYAAQSAEDDAYLYYFASGDGERLALTMMNCPDLPAKLRDRLIDRDHLEVEEEDFTVCTVKTLAGLTAAAKAYHRGDAVAGDTVRFVIIKAPEDGAIPPAN
ncbi:MAG: hypothetical protein AAFW68_07550 [Pseudomonadota bacterium]